MEQQNKYYTPDAGDIYPGYEYEFNGKKENYESVGEWFKNVAGTEPEECSILDQWGLQDGKPSNWYIQQGWIRTKYLDKEDIESCGWEKVEESSNRFGILEIRGRIDKKYPGIIWAEPMGVFWNICCVPVQINNPVPKVFITKTEWGGFTGGKTTVDVYAGECKSINELRTIMKWLNIK